MVDNIDPVTGKVILNLITRTHVSRVLLQSMLTALIKSNPQLGRDDYRRPGTAPGLRERSGSARVHRTGDWRRDGGVGRVQRKVASGTSRMVELPTS